MTNRLSCGSHGRALTRVKHGSAVVPVYRGKVRGAMRYTVAFYLDGRRIRRTFATLDQAKVEARLAAQKIQEGLSQCNDLRPQDRLTYQAATRAVDGIGVPLMAAVEEYVRCRKLLGDISLPQAVEEFMRNSHGVVNGVTVPQAVQALLATKEQDRASAKYLHQLRTILNRFAAAFQVPILHVKSEQIDRWLREQGLAPRSRNNMLACIRVLFSFAKRRSFLAKSGETEAELVSKVKVGDTETEIFRPEELMPLLMAASAKILPVLALGAFSGLRAAELSRLDWSAVNLDRQIIELRAGQAKTASRRIIPIPDNLRAWILKLPNRLGLVIPDPDVFRQTTALARKLGVGWPPNVLRHSYISYRLAQIQDASRVALEAGNSAQIIFKHYRELVTPEQALEWFSLSPPPGWEPVPLRWNRMKRMFTEGLGSSD